MNLLNKLTLKSLQLNKKRTIVTIIGIILSTALIVAVSSLVVSARLSLIEYEKKESGDYHYIVYDVPKEELKYFNNNRVIEKTYFTSDIGYAKVDSQNESKPYLFIKGYSNEVLESKENNLVEGRMPKSDDEIVISSHIKTNGRLYYKVGDTLELEVGKRYSDDYELSQSNPFNDEEIFVGVTKKSYKIVGIIERLPYNEEAFDAPGYTVITNLNEEQEKVDLFIRLNKDGLKDKEKYMSEILGIKEETFKLYYSGTNKEITEEDLRNAEEDIQNSKYEIKTNSYLIKLESSLLEEDSIKSLVDVAVIVIIIIIVTSVFCIKNSFDISITEKTRQYGMLSSIGATKRQIKKNVYFETFILGLIGIPLGIISGLVATYILIIITNYLLKDTLNLTLVFNLSYLAVLVSILLASITIYFSAMRSARKASLTTPIEAIRSNSDIKIKAKKMKSPKIIKKLFGIGGDVSYKNLKRNKKKYRTTIISIVVCVTVFIALSTFINLAFDVVNLYIKEQNYNISLNFKTSSENDPKTINEVINMDNIKDYSVVRENDYYSIVNPKLSSLYVKATGVVEDGDFYIPIKALGEHQYNKYIKKLGLNYNDVKDKAILMNYYIGTYYDEENNKVKKSEIEIFDYQKGDVVNGYLDIRASTEEENIKSNLNFEIAAITNIKPIGDYGSVAYLIVSDEFYDNHLVTEGAYANRKFLYIDSSNPDKLQSDIEELIKSDKDKYYVYNTNEDAKAMKSAFTLIAIFLYGFITVIALIGITNIFNTIITSMNLRRREFAILKCIGMTKKEFNKMIRLESVMYGMKSLIIGIPLGLILSVIIHKALMKGEFDIAFTPPYLAIILVIVFVFGLIILIMKYSLSKINKQNIIETIRNENI